MDWADLAFMELCDEELSVHQKSAYWFVDFDQMILRDVRLRRGDLLVTRGCPNCIGEIDYLKAKIRNGFYAVDGTYQGIGHEPRTHIFRVSEFSLISDVNGMSGSPVFKLRKHLFGMDYWFVGVVLRATKTSGIARFVDCGIIYQALKQLHSQN